MKGLNVSLLRNGWAMVFAGTVYVTGIWGIFLVVNQKELVRAELVRAPESVDEQALMELYALFQEGERWPDNRLTLGYLSEALIHHGRVQEATMVSQEAFRWLSSHRPMRFRLALAFHNAGLYEQAESHFSILLEERGET